MTINEPAYKYYKVRFVICMVLRKHNKMMTLGKAKIECNTCQRCFVPLLLKKCCENDGPKDELTEVSVFNFDRLSQ